MLSQRTDERVVVGNQTGGPQDAPGLIRVGNCPPGVELEQRQFITDPDLHTVGGDELGGIQFNSEARKADSEIVEVLSPSGRQIVPLLAEEVLPELPQIAPLIRRRGPRVLLPEAVEEFCRLLSVGLSRRQAAARLDIDHSTISKAAKEDPELATLLQRAEDVAAGDPLLCLIAASRKIWRAALTLIHHRRQFREPPLAADPEEQLRNRLDKKRRELEYSQGVAILEEQVRDNEAAWQERERLMIAKERAERVERKKRRLERELTPAELASAERRFENQKNHS